MIADPSSFHDATVRWWAKPRRSTCGHRVEWGCDMETTDPRDPTEADLMVSLRIDAMAALVALYPCPWCGGETGLQWPPEGVLLQDRRNRVDGRILLCRQITD